MSDEAKTAEMESVTAFTWMLKAGLPFQIMKCEDGWYAEVYTKDKAVSKNSQLGFAIPNCSELMSKSTIFSNPLDCNFNCCVFSNPLVKIATLNFFEIFFNASIAPGIRMVITGQISKYSCRTFAGCSTAGIPISLNVS